MRRIGIMPRSGDPARVLVVDDDPQAVKIVSGYLTSLGHQVIEAYGGERGIELANEAVPDLIILDLMMPEVNGFMVVERLREKADTRDIPIIVLTAKIVTPDERQSAQWACQHDCGKEQPEPRYLSRGGEPGGACGSVCSTRYAVGSGKYARRVQ